MRLEIKERRESIAGEHGSEGTWVLQRNWVTKIERHYFKYYNMNPITYCIDRCCISKFEHSGVDPSGQCLCCASTDLCTVKLGSSLQFLVDLVFHWVKLSLSEQALLFPPMADLAQPLPLHLPVLIKERNMQPSSSILI